jgi:hypothetical protein
VEIEKDEKQTFSSENLIGNLAGPGRGCLGTGAFRVHLLGIT